LNEWKEEIDVNIGHNIRMEAPESLDFSEYHLESWGKSILLEDWEYCSEGNAHLICRYFGQDTIFAGQVMRIPMKTGISSCFKARDFIVNVMLPLFGGDNILYPQIVSVPSAHLQSVLLKMQESSSNFSNDVWDRMMEELSSSHVSPIMLEPDLTRIQRPDLFDDHCISVEIKVKCGLKSHSPFLSGISMLKRKLGRFQLVQYGKLSRRNDYDPSALCSRDIAKVRSALGTLSEAPYKNLIIKFRGNTVFSEKSQSYDDLVGSFNSFLGTEEGRVGSVDEVPAVLDSFLNLLAGILARDSLLMKLEGVQGLDIFDCEGSQAILTRLIALTGSLDAAERHIEQITCEPIDMNLLRKTGACGTVGSGLLSDRSELDNRPNLSTPLPENVPLGYEKYGEFQRLASMSAECNGFDTLQEKAMCLASSLTAGECSFLLHIWLLAQAARDVSLIIRLSLPQPQQQQQQQPLKSAIQGISQQYVPWYWPCTSNGEGPGAENTMQQTVKYNLSLTDVGPKPVHKVCEKYEKETSIIHEASRLYPLMK
jgi:hypothetical protein